MTLYRPIFYGIQLIKFRNPHELVKCSRNNFGDKFLVSDRWNSVRGFRDKRKAASLSPAPVVPPPETGVLTARTLFKPLVFTVGFSTTSFVGCSIWQYENLRAKAIRLAEGKDWGLSSWFPNKENKSGSWRQQCNDFWNSLSEGQRLFAPVLLANVLVFAAWRVPQFQPAMLKYFASNPAAKVLCWPMILSAFSHYSLFHLAANMFVLHSFSHSFVGTLGKEQATALYLSAGVISSFASYLHKIVVNKPGLSVGASGAIMGILGYVCTQYPDSQLSIILLPMFTFSAGTAIKFIVGIDLAGCLLGWKFFDHAAHLGGALTGICFAYWGNSYIWQKREPIVRWWHEIRNGKI